VSEHAFGKFPTIFVRIKGRSGVVREINALLDPGVEYCVIPKVDAYALGYSEAANDDPISPGDNTITFTSYDGYGKAALIDMVQVEIGTMTFKNVDFIAYDIPQVNGFDVVLGRNLLKFMKLELDYSVGQLRMERKSGSVEN
jgi:predicted aspartyl protease